MVRLLEPALPPLAAGQYPKGDGTNVVAGDFGTDVAALGAVAGQPTPADFPTAIHLNTRDELLVATGDSSSSSKRKAYAVATDGIADDEIRAALGRVNTDHQGAVVLAEGTFTVSQRSGSYNALIPLQPRTHIRGLGRLTTIKLADGATVAGDYRFFAPDAVAQLDDLVISDLTVDGNAPNNLVLGSTGGNIRTGYGVNLYQGSRIVITRTHWKNMAGRNVFALGLGMTNTVTDVWLTNNLVEEVAGSITGNENQSDHSSVYMQAQRYWITGNVFRNTNIPNPDTAPSRVYTAIEAHGTSGWITNNLADGYTNGAFSVAAEADAEDLLWADNTFLHCLRNGIIIDTMSGKAMRRMVARRNHIHLDSRYGKAVLGISQPQSATSTTVAVQDLTLDRNLIWSDNLTPAAQSEGGILLCALDGATLTGNKVRNVQGVGLYFAGSLANLPITNVEVTNNTFDNCGYSTNNATPYAMIANNPGPQIWKGLTFSKNAIRRPDTTGIGRGVLLSGPGSIQDLTWAGDNTFHRIPTPTNEIVQSNTSAFRNVEIVPRRHSASRAADPVRGVWIAGRDIIEHTDPVASGSAGKVVVTTGGAVEAVWAATTAYVVGQWIRTSTNKVLECVTAGTSGSTEPAPTALGEQDTDGTVVWAYRAANLAVFKTYGTISA